MASTSLDARFSDLRKEIKEFQTRFPKLADHDIFLAWFIRAYLVEREDEAAAAAIGKSKDKGIDAVWIDDNAHRAFVLQGKYRQRVNNTPEPRNDVLGFVDVGSNLIGVKDLFDQFLVEVDPLVGDRAKVVRERCLDRNY